MLKRLLRITLAVVIVGAVVSFAKDRIIFGKMAYLRHSLSHEENEDEKCGIAGAIAFQALRVANPITGILDTAAVLSAYKQAETQTMNKYGVGTNLVWTEMGPDNIGGRCRAIIVDKDSNNVLYAGGVTGGIFKSYDGGSSWKKTGNNPVLNQGICSMVQGADGAIYYGTGENAFMFGPSVKATGNSGPGYFGEGVFKSTDHGNNFKQLTATDPTSNTAWLDVSFLAADPTDANRIYAGNDNTLMITTDGGTTWKAANGGLPASGMCKDIRLSKDGNTIYVIMGFGSPPGNSYQIWRSTDKGTSFTKINGTKGSPPTVSSGMMLAIAPSNESTIYVTVANPVNPPAPQTQYSFNGLYRSDDKGNTWTTVVLGDGVVFNPFNNQGCYDNCVAVDPNNYNKCYFGGLNLFSVEQVGGSVQTTQLSDWSNDVNQFHYVNPSYIHADHHIIVFDRNTPYPNMYIGTDGGISKSTNVANPNVTPSTNPPTSFFVADYGFNTTQFYGIGVGADNPSDVIAGAQDNGEMTVMQEGLTTLDGASIDGGDAGYTEISKLNPNTYIEEYVEGAMTRSFDNGNTWSKFFDKNITPGGSGNFYSFMSWMSLWESANDPTSVDSVIFTDPAFAYKAGQAITVEGRNGATFQYILKSDLPKKTPIKVQDPTQSKFYVAANGEIWMTRQVLDKSVSTCEFFRIANIPGFWPYMIRSSLDGNTIFAAGSLGGNAAVYRVTNLSGKKYAYHGGNFSPDSLGIKTTFLFSTPAQTGLGVAIDDNDANHVLFCTGTYNSDNAPHIFASANALDTASLPTFTSISSVASGMPAFPVYDVLIDSHNPKMYLAATDVGIYSTKNGGTSWAEDDNGMERVPVSMLRQQKFSSKPWDGPYIYASTFGRGVFMSSTLTTGINEANNSVQADKLSVSIFPNPVQTTENISVTLPSLSEVTVSVYNVQGRLMSSYNFNHQPAGNHVYNIETTTLQQGTYFVRVNAGMLEQTEKMLVMHN